jgi:membrane protease YdiL (CAAX protease family)
MSDLVLIWKRVPVILRAVLAGFIVAAVGTLPWAGLATLNQKYASGIPWAVPIMAVYLWLYWRYMKGGGWPRSTAEIRRLSCRANSLSDEVWGASILAGIVGLAFVILFQVVLNRMVRLPTQSLQDFSHVPLPTLFLFLVMSAVVAGVVEETAFRGYMQSPIEKRHGPVVAVLVVGLVFGFVHFTHPEVTLILLPYYLAVAAVYGTLAHLTNSVFPGMVLHAGGNILGSLNLLLTNRTEWQASPKPAPLIWETGADASFWISCSAMLIVGAIAVWAYRGLAAAVGKRIHR